MSKEWDDLDLYGYKEEKKRLNKHNFKIGDKVRITKLENVLNGGCFDVRDAHGHKDICEIIEFDGNYVILKNTSGGYAGGHRVGINGISHVNADNIYF